LKNARRGMKYRVTSIPCFCVFDLLMPDW
jgi:hypothetical protein